MKSLAAGKRTEFKLILHENFYKGNHGGREIALATIKKGTPFKELARELGAVKTIFLISEIIRNYCSQFNVSKNMTPDQIEDYAAEIFLDFRDRVGNSVMLEEIVIAFDRAAKGEFCDPRTGKKLIPFDRIDRTLLDQFLDVYFEQDRDKAIQAIEDERNNKARTPDGEDLPRMLQAGAAPVSITDIYTSLAGQPDKLKLAKLLKEMEEKYGESTQPEAIPGNDGSEVAAQ